MHVHRGVWVEDGHDKHTHLARQQDPESGTQSYQESNPQRTLIPKLGPLRTLLLPHTAWPEWRQYCADCERRYQHRACDSQGLAQWLNDAILRL